MFDRLITLCPCSFINSEECVVDILLSGVGRKMFDIGGEGTLVTYMYII